MPLLCSGYLSVRFHGPVLRLKWGQRQEPARAAISGREYGEAAGEVSGLVSVTTSQAWVPVPKNRIPHSITIDHFWKVPYLLISQTPFSGSFTAWDEMTPLQTKHADLGAVCTRLQCF